MIAERIVRELFIRERNRKVSLVFITPSHSFYCANNVIMKIPNKQELQKIEINLLSNIDFKEFVNLY